MTWYIFYGILPYPWNNHEVAAPVEVFFYPEFYYFFKKKCFKYAIRKHLRLLAQHFPVFDGKIRLRTGMIVH